MPISKNDLVAALDQMDKTNDKQWTDSGTPRVSVVRSLAKDETITRAMIDDLVPGFSRNPPKAPEVSAVIAEGAADPSIVLKSDPAADPQSGDFDPTAEPEVNGQGRQYTEEEVREILLHRVNVADAAIEAAQIAVRDAQALVQKNIKRKQVAQTDLNRRFPPMDENSAIKAHLAGQQKLLADRVAAAGGHGTEQLDQAMLRRNSRGWSRPSRPLNNAPGQPRAY